MAVVESANVSTSQMWQALLLMQGLHLQMLNLMQTPTIIDIAQIEANQICKCKRIPMTVSTEYIIIDVGTSDFTSAGATENSQWYNIYSNNYKYCRDR